MCSDCADTPKEQPGPRSEERTKVANSRDKAQERSDSGDPNRAGRDAGEMGVGGTDPGHRHSCYLTGRKEGTSVEPL